MKIEANYTLRMSEDELKLAIEFYMRHKYKQSIKVGYVKHKFKQWTEGHGMGEIDYSEPDGLEISAMDFI